MGKVIEQQNSLLELFNSKEIEQLEQLEAVRNKPVEIKNLKDLKKALKQAVKNKLKEINDKINENDRRKQAEKRLGRKLVTDPKTGLVIDAEYTDKPIDQDEDWQYIEHVKDLYSYQLADVMRGLIKFAFVGESEQSAKEGLLYWYNIESGLYEPHNITLDLLIRSMQYNCGDNVRKTIMDYVRTSDNPPIPWIELNKDPNLTALGNGIYNKAEKRLMPFSSEYAFLSKVKTNYNPNITQEPTFNGWRFSDWVKEIAEGDEAKELLIWHMIAKVLTPNQVMDMSFWLVDDGQGRTGKSTMQKLLINLVGLDNVGALRLKQLETRFDLGSVYRKSLIIGDDNNPNDFIDTSANFKSCATGELVQVEIKGIQSFPVSFRATIIQSMNGLPRFKDNSDGMSRRVRIIKFNKQYPATAEGRLIKEKYVADETLLQWILFKALQYDLSVIANTQESLEATGELKKDSDPVVLFVEEYFNKLKSDRIPAKFLYMFFKLVMQVEEGNPSKLSQRTFTTRLKQALSKEWKHGRQLTTNGLFSVDDINLYNDYARGHSNVEWIDEKETSLLNHKEQKSMFYKE